MSEEETHKEVYYRRPKSDSAADAEETGENKAPEEESTATFEPVVKLDVVETKTGEEEEETLYSTRAKLFISGETILDKGTGKKILMHQEKTMKILANHVLDPRITLETNAGSDRSWVWSAFDYSEGAEMVETVFAARFSNSESANEFKEKFLEAQVEMKKILAREDDSTGKQEAEEVAASFWVLVWEYSLGDVCVV